MIRYAGREILTAVGNVCGKFHLIVWSGILLSLSFIIVLDAVFSGRSDSMAFGAMIVFLGIVALCARLLFDNWITAAALYVPMVFLVTYVGMTALEFGILGYDQLGTIGFALANVLIMAVVFAGGVIADVLWHWRVWRAKPSLVAAAATG